MGLIADYVEANRLRAGYGDIDPCMIVNTKHFYHCNQDIRKALRDYHNSADDSAEKQNAKLLLKRQIATLESIKAHYILGEKTILKLMNRGTYQPQVLLSLKELVAQIRDALASISDIIGKLVSELGTDYTFQPIDIDEMTIKERILKIILDDFIGYLRNNLTLEPHEVKRSISDCASMIQILEEESYVQPNKYIVQLCLLQHGMITKASYCCQNCHKILYQEIDYCLNCNERTKKHE